MVLASLMVAATPAPAEAGTLSWGDDKNIPKPVEGILTPGISVLDIVANGDTVYAASGTNTLYKSVNGGFTWTEMSNAKGTTSYPSTVTTQLVAVAPDDPDVVAFAHSGTKVELSTNGGSKWTDLGTIAEGTVSAGTIYDIDLGVDSSGNYYVGVAAQNNAGKAELFTYKTSLGEGWQARTTNDGTGANATQEKMLAVMFSPNFETDKIILCVSANDTANKATLQAFRYESGAYTWNGSIAYFSTWTAENAQGVTINTGSDSTAVAGGAAAAALAVPDTYLGTDDGERVVFAAVAGTTSGGGVSRVIDTYDKNMRTWNAGDEGPIGSLAYHDSGKLIAGDYDGNQVYVALSPYATTPQFERLNDLKQPGGTNKTTVAWSGDAAVAATQGDESAFARSIDDGYSFSDYSLIDTEVAVGGVIADIDIAADGDSLYMTSYDSASGGTNDVSVWYRNANDQWARVFSKKDVATAAARFLVRSAPGDMSAVYIGSLGTVDGNVAPMWASKDGGMTKWRSVPIYRLDSVTDFAVMDADTVYAIDPNEFSKTTNAGASWGSAKGLDLNNTSYMMHVADNGDIFIGDTGGYVSFSVDGGSSFSRILDGSDNANCLVITDADYADNGKVYIACGNEIERGAADTQKTWASREPTFPAGTFVATGIGRVGNVIYVMFDETAGSDSYLYRALDLAGAGTPADAKWSYAFASGERYNLGPNVMKISDGPKIWAIDSASPALEYYGDPIATAGPTLHSPADGADVKLNSITGKAQNVAFSVERYSSKYIEEMRLQIATDPDFEGIVYSAQFAGIDMDQVIWTVGPTASAIGGVGAQIDYNPGDTYYWRVRVEGATTGDYADTIISTWSDVRSFTVEGIDSFAVSGPARGATGVGMTPTLLWSDYPGAIGYEVMVAEDPTFAIIEFSHSTENTFYQIAEELAYATTYYWRVRGVTGPAPPKGAAPGGPWITGVFTTMEEPVPEPEPEKEQVIVVQKEPAPPAEVKIVEVPVQQAAPIPAYLLWTIIGIGAILIIALIVLIVRTRRVA
jgi:hypothetical protein